MALQIEIDPAVPSDIAALVPVWLEDVMAWLLNQPRPAGLDGQQPRFSELKYSIAMGSPNRGLSSRITGDGWVTLGVSNNLVLDTLPVPLVFSADTETATKTRWVFLLSQCFRPESYTDKENFRHEEHLYFQMKFLEEFAPSLAKEAQAQIDAMAAEEKQKAYKAQFAQKRKLKQERQREAWKLRTPEWYRKKTDPHYSSGRTQLPPVPPPQLRETPTPELDEFQRKALAERKAMEDYILRNTVCTDSICEDGDM